MRKPSKALSGQSDLIYGSIHFNGLLEDDSDVLSDISFYEYEIDNADDNVGNGADFHSPKKKENIFLSKNEKQLKLSTELKNKARKIKVEALDEHSVSDTDVKAYNESYNKSAKKHQKSSKKTNKGSRGSIDYEGDMRSRKKGEPNEIASNRRGSTFSEIDHVSGFSSVKSSDAGEREDFITESLNGQETNAIGGISSVQSFQRKKKLCKAVDLKSTSKKGHKLKDREHVLERKGKIGGKDRSLGLAQKNRLVHISSDSESSPRNTIKRGFWKDQKEWDQEEDATGLSSLMSHHGPNQSSVKSVIRSGKISGQAMDLSVNLKTTHGVLDPQKCAVEKVCDDSVVGEEVISDVTEGAEENKDLDAAEDVNEELGVGKLGWIMCKSCGKWRCIPAVLIDKIESSDSIWLCKHNPNKKFADCSVPQEKINRELNSSESSSFCEESDEKQPVMNPTEVDSIEHQGQPQPTWTFIKQNIFQHRQRKVEEIDEQMICSCEPPEDGSLGCGEDCLNRSLNIECISQTCPCGDACSNQRFQKQSYKKVAFFQCGKKGFGLQVLENVPKGDFILEYVGEVLNSTAYEARHHEYQQNGQKHYYFMALSDSEIIDAYCKGNLGRFINHSCQPNCNVEKWMINGEVCVGVFANRELKKGEEITVDVGAFGAAAIECLCGSHRCRGVIGGDSVNPLDARNKDFDTDFTEPAMDVSFIEESKRIKSARQKPHHENKWTAQKNGRHFEGVEEELNKLVDENGGLRKGQPFVATSFLKLLVRTYASLMSAERSRSSRDISMVLDALLKTHSRAILLDILTTHGFQVLHKMLKQNKKDYKRTPIIRKLLKVLEFLAARRVLTVDQINAVPTRSNMESLKDTIFELGRHGDVEIRHMAHHFKDTYLKASSEKLARRNQVGSSDSSKWRLFPKQNQGGTSAPDVAEHDNTKKRKRSSRWDQPSRDVLEITQTADHRVKQTDGASMDELGQTYPGLPSLLSPESQNIAEGAEQGPGVLSVRRDQFSAASTGHVSQQQQGPICIGIPVSQFHGVGGPAPELSCVPQVLNSCPVVHPPDRHVSSFGSSTMKMQEQRQHEFNDQSTKTENEKVKVNFGVSHSHFFEEMREMFGSAFHPWQIQCLMASHAWGPYLTGDARLRELGPINDSASVFRQSNQYRSTEESSSKLAEQTGSWGPVQDVELPASGVTSLPPSSALPQFTHPMPMNAPNVSSGMLSMAGDAERGNAPYIHSKSSSYRPQQWDSSSLSRFHGNRYRNTGMSRDSSHSLQPHHQNIGSQDLNPHRSHPHNWKESSWKNLDSNQGYPNVQGANNATTTAPGVDGRHDAVPDPSFHDSQNTSRNMSLENSTGHNQQYPSRDHISFYGNVS